MDDLQTPTDPDRVFETVFARLALTASRPIPGPMVQPVLDLMVAVLRRRHPGAWERLTELDEGDVLIDPVDMPRAFRIGLGPAGVRLELCDRDVMADAVVRGEMRCLLDLMEGRTDGDALFFSRDLTIEGDTELVVALRNALDGEDIDLLADLGAALGPLAGLLNPARQAALQLHEGMAALRGALLSPANRRLDTLERRLNRLERKGS